MTFPCQRPVVACLQQLYCNMTAFVWIVNIWYTTEFQEICGNPDYWAKKSRQSFIQRLRVIHCWSLADLACQFSFEPTMVLILDWASILCYVCVTRIIGHIPLLYHYKDVGHFPRSITGHSGMWPNCYRPRASLLLPVWRPATCVSCSSARKRVREIWTDRKWLTLTIDWCST